MHKILYLQQKSEEIMQRIHFRVTGIRTLTIRNM